MTLVTLPSAPLDLLLGPLTVSASTAYDTLYLTQAAAFETASDVQRNFYDGALAYYMLYYRTGDSRWATRADALALDEADTQMLPGNLDGGGRSGYAARDYATLGMAVHYLRTSHANSLSAVRAQAAGAAWYFPWTPNSSNQSPREGAYSIMAMLTSTILGGGPDYSTDLSTALTNALGDQGHDYNGSRPHDSWQSRDTGSLVPALYYNHNFMTGLFTEAFIMYDRVIGDSRIVPMLKRYADWLWANQWVPLGGGTPITNGTSTTSVTIGTGSKTFTTQSGLSFPAGANVHAVETGSGVSGMVGTVTSYSGTTLIINSATAEGSGTFTAWSLGVVGYPNDQSANGVGCFQYASLTSGAVSTNSNANYSDLIGLNAPVFGYLYAKGQGSTYKTRCDAIIAALQGAIFFLTKQFNQPFRASPRAVGWTDSATMAATGAPRGAAWTEAVR